MHSNEKISCCHEFFAKRLYAETLPAHQENRFLTSRCARILILFIRFSYGLHTFSYDCQLPHTLFHTVSYDSVGFPLPRLGNMLHSRSFILSLRFSYTFIRFSYFSSFSSFSYFAYLFIPVFILFIPFSYNPLHFSSNWRENGNP